MIKSTFLNILKKYEQKLNIKLSRREFSRITGIKYSITVRLFNNQIHGLKFDTLDKLVKFFHIPPSKFLAYYQPRPLIIQLANADSDLSKSAVRRGDLDDLDENPNPKGILLSFSNDKLALHVVIVPCKPTSIPEFPSDIDIDFDYQVIDNHGFIDFPYSMTKMSLNRHFRYIFNNHFDDRLMKYIYSRLLLCSGFFNAKTSKHDFLINGSMAHASRYTRSENYTLNFPDGHFDTNVDGLIHLWKRQPTEYDDDKNKYRLISSHQNQPISIHDYTTNNFKD